MSKYFDGELLSGYEQNSKTTMCNTSEYVDLLNREMERLQGYLKGKKEPQTATECEELVRPFVYKIEELTAHNYIKDQRIAELEEQLKNAIVPKFKKGQEVFYINSRNKISSGVIYNVRYDSVKGFDYYIPMLQLEDFRIKEENVFATKKEAQAKLKELQGDNK